MELLELNAQTFFLKGLCSPQSLDVSGLEEHLPKNINVPLHGIIDSGSKEVQGFHNHVILGNDAHKGSGFITLNVHLHRGFKKFLDQFNFFSNLFLAKNLFSHTFNNSNAI